MGFTAPIIWFNAVSINESMVDGTSWLIDCHLETGAAKKQGSNECFKKPQRLETESLRVLFDAFCIRIAPAIVFEIRRNGSDLNY